VRAFLSPHQPETAFESDFRVWATWVVSTASLALEALDCRCGLRLERLPSGWGWGGHCRAMPSACLYICAFCSSLSTPPTSQITN